MRWFNVAALTVKIILGLLFVVSALAKFFSIDSFEMYVYSFGLMSMPVSLYTARLLIGFELLLGSLLISNRWHRLVSVVTVLFLVVFVVFLTYAQLIGRTDSCHCFGELLPFNPLQSIMKNAVLLALVLFANRFSPSSWTPRWWLVLSLFVLLASAVSVYFVSKFHFVDLLTMGLMAVGLVVALLAVSRFYARWYVTLIMIFASIISVFILSPPDNLMFSDTDEKFDKELFLNSVVIDSEKGNMFAIDSDSITLHINPGKQVVAFLSPTCGYCLLAGEKLSTIVSRNGIEESKILYVFPNVRKKEIIDRYFVESHSKRFNSTILDKFQFIKITRASFPLVLCVDDGKVVASMGYRNLSERVIAEFMKGE